MTFKVGLVHVLRHCWLWPIQFWLRPLDMGDRLAKYGAAEAWAAIAGRGIWGALIGTVIWLATGETQAIWGLAVAVAVVYQIIIISAGLALGVFAPTAAFGVTVLAGIWVVGSLIYGILRNKDMGNLWGVIFFLVLPIGGWGFLPRISLELMPAYGIGLVVPFALGCVDGVFLQANGLWDGRKANNMRKISHAGTAWLAVIWVSGPLLALAAWWPDIETAHLNTKLDQLALFLILMPPITTGLPFWPLLAVMAAWQFRSCRARHHNSESFTHSLPFEWQTFAYPLPGLRRYLRTVCRFQGAQAAFEAIQTIQLGSLQMAKARQAAFDLAANLETALPFCGHLAISTNSATLAPFSLAGPAARAVAVLAWKPDKEDEQPLRLFVGDYPPKQASLLKSLSNDWITEFENSRASALSARLKYAISQFDKPKEITQGPEFSQLLQAFHVYSSANIQNILSLPQLDTLKLKMGEASSESKHASDSEWLIQGWNVLLRIATILGQFRRYQNLNTIDARRDFLQERTNALRAVAFDDVSAYWHGIGLELAALWAERLEQEIKQAREWLRLDIQLSQAEFPPGTQILNFSIYNPTRVLAQQLRLIVSNSDGLEWHHREVTRGLLEGGDEARLGLELEARQAGPLRIAGRLEAEDVAGNAITVPFLFQIQVAEAGKPYQIPPYQPYVIGEGLGDDRTFVGREDLLHWLRGLWLQPQGKPAVALVGQRRIGKTSLLNKIRRDGLPDTGLQPVLVNVQGVKGDYDFLDSVAREMAEQLGLAKPVLDRVNPYPDFKDFLLGLKPDLAGRRFLLMLDEADLIPERSLGEDLPGFLRGLMQEPQYPVLLLFCGTHALKHMGREYRSILFNTAQFRTVSYMSQAESAEVLRKPAGEWLEYDSAVLQEAYRLTQGQPLLLQSLGARLINRFDEEIRQGNKRSTFVTFNDLNAAAEDVVKQGNAAFENHRQFAGAATHRFLAGLAWATDETDRLQLNIAGIEAALAETGLGLPEGETFRIAERLHEEEILTRAGPTYRYAVPMYRRWVAWHKPPEVVRQESMG